MIKLFGKSQILKKDETLDVYRLPSTPFYKDGKPVQRERFVFQIVANVQPINGRDLLMVPEHDRFKEQFYVWVENSKFKTDMGLSETGPAEVIVNDIIQRLGANYQVQSAEDWGTYTRIRMMRVDIGPNRTP